MTEAYIHGVEVLTVLTNSRPIKTSKLSIVGLIGTAPNADADIFPLNTPVAVTAALMTAALGTGGSLLPATDDHYDNGGGLLVVVRVAEGVDEAATLANIVGSAAFSTGVHAFKTAHSLIQMTPRILIATGWTHQRPGDNANPVTAELKGILKDLLAVAYVDSTSTTDADALAHAQEIGDPRIRLFDPWVTVFDTESASSIARPLSARAAGRRSWIDRNHGVHYSLSSFPIDGITGLARPIVHVPHNPDSQTNRLNAGFVTTTINEDGFLFWGNEATDGTFQLEIRVKDMILMRMQSLHNNRVDRPQSIQGKFDTVGDTNAYIRKLKSLGVIFNGLCWLDEELNTGESVGDGHTFYNFDVAVTTPNQRMTFRIFNNDGYYQEFADDVIAAVNSAST